MSARLGMPAAAAAAVMLLAGCQDSTSGSATSPEPYRSLPRVTVPTPSAGTLTGPLRTRHTHTTKPPKHRTQPTHHTTAPPTRRTGSGTALAALAAIAVKGRAPMTGYDRDQFGPAWTDDSDAPFSHNGCDTRNDVLRRDLTHLVVETGTYDCVVLSGTLDDPYTGSTIHFTRGVETSYEVQIDHVVALGDAWQTGAQGWPAERRRDFANDPLNLLAVYGPPNEAKGDGDAATWLPPDHAFRCRYVARQVAVKAKYHLWMTSAEKASTRAILDRCPGTPLPVEPGRLHPPSGFVERAYHSSPSPPAHTTTSPPPGGKCEPGYSPCLPIVDDLDCDQIPDSEKPIRVTGDDPYRLDSDGDGWGCEP